MHIERSKADISIQATWETIKIGTIKRDLGLVVYRCSPQIKINTVWYLEQEEGPESIIPKVRNAQCLALGTLFIQPPTNNY